MPLCSLLFRRCWTGVGSIVYKQLHSADRSVLRVMNRTATEPSCRTVALSHTAKHTALCSPGRAVAHSVWRCVSDRSCAECKWRVAVRTRTLVAGTLDPAICPSVVILRAVSKLPAHSGAVRLRSGSNGRGHPRYSEHNAVIVLCLVVPYWACGRNHENSRRIVHTAAPLPHPRHMH
jgi:hypothetical protein